MSDTPERQNTESQSLIEQVADRVLARLRESSSPDVRQMAAAACALDSLSCDALADALLELGMDSIAVRIRALPIRKGDVLLLSIRTDDPSAPDPDDLQRIVGMCQEYFTCRLGFNVPVFSLPDSLTATILRFADSSLPSAKLLTIGKEQPAS